MILVCDQRSSRRTRVGPCVDGAYWAATSCRLSPTADSVPDVLLYFGMSHMVLSAPGRKLILDVCEAKRLQEKGSVGMMMPPTRQLQLRFFTKNKSTNHQHRVFCPPELLPSVSYLVCRGKFTRRFSKSLIPRRSIVVTIQPVDRLSLTPAL